MRFEIETEKTEMEHEPVLRLALKMDSAGDVSLTGKDADGFLWYLMTLKRDGTICRETSVGAIGIQVDGRGRILTREEE